MAFPPPGNNNSSILGDMVPWLIFGILIFVVVIVVFSITAPFLWGPRLIRRLSGTTGPIKNGVPSDAIIESIADTGVTVTMRGVGAYAPDYRFVLQVTPVGGGAPYRVETKALVPRLYMATVVPGARVGVLIDPTNPMKLWIDFSRMGGAPGAGWSAGPAAGDIPAPIGAVRGGTLPTINGGNDHILATGTHGSAVITMAQPTGKTLRDIDPAADPSRLTDPIWLFTVEVSLAGEKPFRAIFGHRVPLAKLAAVAPGVKLAVAVDQSDSSQAVAIDWDKSPIGA
jgi:hypothetical protein